MQHIDLVIEQFTRQAVGYANAASIRNDDLLNRIVQTANVSPDDTVLDVACGPGLLVCAFASRVKHVTGIDLTPAMLELATQLQKEQKLSNVDWVQGDGISLPFGKEKFSIVTSRYAFHHFANPIAVLKEMRRVCRKGGKIIVVDSSPEAAKAEAFNAMEYLRDPSHVRAMPVEEICSLFREVGLENIRVERYRLAGTLDALLARSFPKERDADRVRKLFEDSLTDDFLDIAARRANDQMEYFFPISIVAGTVPVG